MNWLDISTGVGGLLGNLGSSIGGLFQAGANRRFQAKQAALQRQFNASEAQKAREYNTQMVNAQNQYNSPSEQVKRLVAAGLHPALAYGGNGAVQNIGVGSTSAQASSGASPSGAMADLSSLGTIGSDLASGVQALSQSRVNESIRGLNDNELKYYDAFAKHNLARINSEIAVNFSLKDKTDAEIREVCATTDQIKVYTDLLGQEWLNAHTQGEILQFESLIKKLDAAFASETYQMRVDKVAHELDITRKEAETFMSALLSQLALNAALANQADKNSEYIDTLRKDVNQRIRSGLNWKLSRLFDKQADSVVWNMDTWFGRQAFSVGLNAIGDIADTFVGNQWSDESHSSESRYDNKGNFRRTERSDFRTRRYTGPRFRH